MNDKVVSSLSIYPVWHSYPNHFSIFHSFIHIRVNMSFIFCSLLSEPKSFLWPSIQSQQPYPIASFLPIQHNQLLLFISTHFSLFHRKKQKIRSYDEGKNKTWRRWAISSFVPALRARSQPPSLASVVVDVLWRGSAVGGVTASRAGSDIAGGIRLLAVGNIAGVDAVWIGDVLHRVRVDAVGSGIGHALLRRRNPLQPLRLRPLHSLLRHRSTLAT